MLVSQRKQHPVSGLLNQEPSLALHFFKIDTSEQELIPIHY
jgi:hypothetical protein